MTNPAYLHDAVAAVCPIAGVSLGPGSPPAVRIDFDPAATEAQRDAAGSVVAGWDWSPEAEPAREAEAAVRAAAAVLSSLDAVPTGVRAGLCVVFQALNWVVREYNADRQARGLPPLALPPDLTAVAQTPFDVPTVRGQTAAVLTGTTWAVE